MYKSKSILVVEDNEVNMQSVCKILSNIEDLNIYQALNVETAYKYAMEMDIDVFIVDIILDRYTPGDVSGVKFIESIRKIKRYKFSPVIMTTCLEDPKLHAYTYLHCYHYFEKPFDKTEFEKTVRDALHFTRPKEEKKYIYYKKEGVLFSIKIKEIVYIENHNASVLYHCVNNVNKAPYKSCKKILEEISSNDFIQCSKGTIVNRTYIHNIDLVNRYITLKNNYGILDIGIRMKKQFMSRLKND